MEKIDKAIEILQALKEGKTVERSSYILHSGEWSDWNEFEFNGKNIDLINSQYRIKKQPTYRPYANAEEFIKASKEHGLIITDKGYYYLPVVYGKDGLTFDGEMTSYEDLLEYYTFEKDNTPCGVLEG